MRIGGAGTGCRRWVHEPSVSPAPSLSCILLIRAHTEDGTAIAGTDYTALDTLTRFALGTTDKTINVSVKPNVDPGIDRDLALVVDSVTATAQPPSVGFGGAGGTIGTGDLPVDAVVADFDLDGRPDVAAAIQNTDSVSVFLNDTPLGATSPSFPRTASFATGNQPEALATADFNRDGRSDLAVTASLGDSVSLVRNTSVAGAAPAFASAGTLGTGDVPRGVAAADFNGDGAPDLAVASNTTSAVQVFANATAVGATSFTFGAPLSLTTGTGPVDVAAGDLDGDGRIDLVVSNGGAGANSVTVFRNVHVDGSAVLAFDAGTAFTTVNQPGRVEIGDVNDDGLPDLVATSRTGDTISILVRLPGAAIAFASRVNIGGGNGADGLAIVDLNNDGKGEIVVAARDENSLRLYANATYPGGSPDFVVQGVTSFGTGMRDVVAADFNGDGRADLIGVASGADKLFVRFNTTPLPGLLPAFETGGSLTLHGLDTVRAADINGDGVPDLVIELGFNDVGVALGKTLAGASTVNFGTPEYFSVTTGTNTLRCVAVADFNGDGVVDIATHSRDATLRIFRNDTAPFAATTAFAAPVPFTVGGASSLDIEAVDLNMDGRPDIAIVDHDTSKLQVILNTSPGGSDTITCVSLNPPDGASGLEFSGTNWSCPVQGSSTICRYDSIIRAGEAAEPLMMSLAAPEVPGKIRSFAQASNKAQPDNNLINNSSSTPTSVVCADPSTLGWSTTTPRFVEEATLVDLTVTRSGSCGAVSVKYRLRPGSADPQLDYSDTSGVLKWAHGESGSKSFRVELLEDTEPEATESFRAILGTARGASLVSPSRIPVKIIDDD